MGYYQSYGNSKDFETRMRNVTLPCGKRTQITSIRNEYGCRCSFVGGNVNLITLKPKGFVSGREHRMVIDQMLLSLDDNYKPSLGYSIKKIVKVQNCCLWAKFRKRERQIARELGYVNERMLFHGSGAAETIVKNGFDISMAKAGGWFGRGVYFADNSAKSDDFAHRLPTQRKTMLFCRVALGKEHVQGNKDTTLLRPPPGRHSIVGTIGVPEIIVYNDAQAYPEYLIYYDAI